jgi:hypothetical protein
MVTITPEEYEAMQDRISGKQVQKKARNKYNAKKTDYRGHTYDSKKEAEYARGLDLAMKVNAPGAPLEWERQVRMPVKLNGKHICYYILDFLVTYEDRVEHIDVKGMKSGPAYAMFKLKKKLIEAYHEIEIKEV